MEKNKNATKGIIQTGEENGVKLSVDVANDRYLIEMPNKYDLTHVYNNYQRVEYVNNPNSVDKSNNVIYASKSVFEMTEQDQKQLMYDVRKTRNTNLEITQERDIFTTAITFDISPQKPIYVGIPLQAKRDENNNIMKNANDKVIPTPGYVKGEILAVGKYLIAIKNVLRSTTEQAVINLIETSKFLVLEDYKEHDRLLAVQKKLGLDPEKDIKLGEVNKGINKYISFNENGLVKAIGNAYTKEVKQEIAEEPKQVHEKAKTKTKERSLSR